MTKEDIHVELLYLWDKYKEDIQHILLIITIPIWLPVFIILFPFFFWDVENIHDDEEWCRQNGYNYPCDLGWGAHTIVKRWRKAKKNQEKQEKKQMVRDKLLMKKIAQ